MVGDVTIGIQALARGIGLLNKPGVRIYVVIPLCINLLLFGALIWYGYSLFTPAVEWMMSFVPDFLDFLEWLIWLVFGVTAALVVFFSFTPVANIVAAPFNALMSEKIEMHLTGKAPSSDISFAKMAWYAIKSQLGKLLYILLWALALTLISLIPLVNFLAPVLWVVFGSWLLSLEYFDYPMGNRDLSFDEEKRYLRQRRGIALGFGGGIMVLTSIPVVNFITMPVAVAGATLLWVEQFQRQAEAE
jgi:CysZ protein